VTAAEEIIALVDQYGKPAPSLLPWAAQWAHRDDLFLVARTAAAQVQVTPLARWPAVADAVAETLARRASERPRLLSQLVSILPPIAGHFSPAQVAAMTRAPVRTDALAYAELATGIKLVRPEQVTGTAWQELLTAPGPLPPLANLRLLSRLAGRPEAELYNLLGAEVIYLLPYIGTGPGRGAWEDAAVAEIGDYLPVPAGWYATALCARAAPFLAAHRRSLLRDNLDAAPPAWAALMRQFVGAVTVSWPSAAAELTAAHPATPSLTLLEREADPAELAAAAGDIARRIFAEYGDPDLDRWRAPEEGVERGARDRYAYEPEPQPDIEADWQGLREIPFGIPQDEPREADENWDVADREPSPTEPPQAPYEVAAAPPVTRYLRGQCPETIPVGESFSLLASIVATPPAGAAVALLKMFPVPAGGADVLLVVHAPGLRLLGRQRQAVHVPATGDSEPVMFELRADAPGPHRVSMTAWIGGSYLGELTVEVTAERYGPRGPDREVSAEIAAEPTEGTVSLVVRYDPVQNSYRFEFRDDDNPDEVTTHLAYDPRPQVEQLVAQLDDLAEGRGGYSAALTRDFLVNAGAALWHQLVPGPLRDQFWERQHRIRRLTILADKDIIPWELLYPLDQGHDAGFLVQQFPVTRAVFRHRPSTQLRLRPARFVVPESSLLETQNEVEALRRLLEPEQPPEARISALTPLLDLIRSADFRVLHFACHNSYDPAYGSSITLDGGEFTPLRLTTAAIRRVLQRSAPLVFINACRSAGQHALYNSLDGWASAFLEAGAGAFVGSLWAVSDETAPRFAYKLYELLKSGKSLGQAAMQARGEALESAADSDSDPTWLAYAVYGDPRATAMNLASSRSEGGRDEGH
jgi:CHAT domain